MTSGARPKLTTTLRRAALVAVAALLALLLPAAAGAYPAPASQKLASGLQTWVAESNVREQRELKAVSWWGHDDLHARYYSNTLGRFVSVDPVGGDVGSSQSWNRYAYVENNPIRMVDPDGRDGLDGGLIKHEHNTAMGIYPPTISQKEAAWLAGLGTSLALAAVTGGEGTVLNLLWSGLSNTAGGVVARGLDGDDSTAAFDMGSMVVDGGSGVLATRGAQRLLGVKVVSTNVDNVLGVGAARFAGNPLSSVASGPIGTGIDTVVDFGRGEADLIVSSLKEVAGPSPDAQDPSVSCHAANPVLSVGDVEYLQGLTVSAH